jgi:metal transporter CNNM
MDAWITQRGATDEIREHLKHLGPSNLASRPRQTRYQSVKIKRGGGSPTRSGQTDLESGRSRSESQRRDPTPTVGLTGGIGAGLLQSGMDAKDGAFAVKAGYGTMDQSGDQLQNDENQPLLKDDLHMSIPEPVHEEGDDHDVESPRGSRPASKGSSDSTQYTDRLKPFNYKHRGPARSGSITEQVIDVNGIRKVVLHTTSTSSSEAEGKRAANKQNGADVDHDTNKSETDRPSTRSAKKRRRRRKRQNNSGKGLSNGQQGEDQPLLSQ